MIKQAKHVDRKEAFRRITVTSGKQFAKIQEFIYTCMCLCAMWRAIRQM